MIGPIISPCLRCSWEYSSASHLLPLLVFSQVTNSSGSGPGPDLRHLGNRGSIEGQADHHDKAL